MLPLGKLEKRLYYTTINELKGVNTRLGGAPLTRKFHERVYYGIGHIIDPESYTIINLYQGLVRGWTLLTNCCKGNEYGAERYWPLGCTPIIFKSQKGFKQGWALRTPRLYCLYTQAIKEIYTELSATDP